MSGIARKLKLFFLIFTLGLFSGPQGAWGQTAIPTATPSQLQEETEVAPVVIDGVELFIVRGIRSFPAEKRANQIRDRILEVAKDRSISPDSVERVLEPNRTEIRAGDKNIMFIFDADARLEGISRSTLSEAILRITQDALERYREDRQPKRLRLGLYLSLAATFILLVVLFLFRWVFGKISRVLRRKIDESGDRVIHFRKLEILEANRFWRGVANFFSGLRILLTLILFYFFLQFVLGQFPWTRFIATRLLDLVIRPLRTIGTSLIDYIPSLFFLLVLAGVVTLLLKFVKSLFGSVERRTFSLPGFDPEWARPTYRIIRTLIIIFSLVVAYPYIPGSDTAAFKGVSIFVGLLVSLGSTSAIANIIAGYSLIYRRSFKVGDRIQVGEIIGDVIDMRLQVTYLLTIKNEAVTVPNSLILNSHVINYSTLSKTQGLILHTTVGIGYEVPWRQVEAMLIRAAQRTPGVLQEPPPFVLKKALGDFAVTYEINVYCEDSHKMAKIYSELNSQILDEFNEYGVAIMTPAYEGDPETPKVVPKEKWFTPPAAQPNSENSKSKNES